MSGAAGYKMVLPLALITDSAVRRTVIMSGSSFGFIDFASAEAPSPALKTDLVY